MSLQSLRDNIKKKMKFNNDKSDYINYADLLKREWFIDEMKRAGVVIIPKGTYKGLGYSLIVLGGVTWFIPFTTIPLILMGCYMLGVSPYEFKERLRKMFKSKMGDFY